MRISLIVTTYNRKEALAMVLQSTLRQTRLPDEIIVADDGSSDGTDMVVTGIAANAPMPVIHSWQEDTGFRAAMSRNKAIAKATGEYIILIDGDMVLEKHFVADHLAAAREGFFVQGGRVLLNEAITQAIIGGRKMEISLFEQGLGNRKNCLRSRVLSLICSHASTGLDGIRTCNFAFWRTDALAVNGFNEDFEGWGREDSEFAVRLLNMGIKRRNLRFAAVAFHLHHPMQSRTCVERNDSLVEETILSQRYKCINGIDKYL